MNSCLSTGLVTSSQVVTDHKSYFNGLLVVTDGTNNATVIVYDNASAASGTILAKLVVTGSANTASFIPIRGVNSQLGLYLSISGTGAAAQCLYGAS